MYTHIYGVVARRQDDIASGTPVTSNVSKAEEGDWLIDLEAQSAQRVREAVTGL